jgi:hypothetical protein
LSTIGRVVVDALIWIVVVLVPVLGIPVLIALAVIWGIRRAKRRPPSDT